MNGLASVVFKGLSFDTAPRFLQHLQCLIVVFLSAKRSEIARVNITHLGKQVALDVRCRGVLDHFIDQGDTLAIKGVCFLSVAHLPGDLCFDCEIPWD